MGRLHSRYDIRSPKPTYIVKSNQIWNGAQTCGAFVCSTKLEPAAPMDGLGLPWLPYGAVYTMDHEVVPRPSKRCDWTLKSSRDDLGLHQGKNGRVIMEVEVHKFVFLSLLYPLPWSNGFFVGTSKRGGLGKLARAHVINLPF
jgi:hypothetical protein